MKDRPSITGLANIGAQYRAGEVPGWKTVTRVEKFWVGETKPYEVKEVVGNLAMNEGWDVLWSRAITLAPTTGTSGGVLQAFSSGNAAIAVGISTAAIALNQTDLQAATGSTARWIKPMSTASYPAHTTGTSTAARTVQFQSAFTATEANFDWNEWAIFNDPNTTGVNGSYALGQMLNRKIGSLGSKTSAAAWTITASLTGSTS